MKTFVRYLVPVVVLFVGLSTPVCGQGCTADEIDQVSSEWNTWLTSYLNSAKTASSVYVWMTQGTSMIEGEINDAIWRIGNATDSCMIAQYRARVDVLVGMYGVAANPYSTGAPTGYAWQRIEGLLTTANTAAFNQLYKLGEAQGDTCKEDIHTMCLVNGRYKVTSHWLNQYDPYATATTLSQVPLTGYEGAFWIANSRTHEYLIRFNMATNNGKVWIAIPPFTDVEFWVEVTDTVNGQYKEYHSAAGSSCLIYDPEFFVHP